MLSIDLHPFIIPPSSALTSVINTSLLFGELKSHEPKVFCFHADTTGFHLLATLGIKGDSRRNTQRLTSLLTPFLGWYEGERLRDGERGWFLAECGEPITCPATIERNVQRMDRLKGLETNV